MLISAKPIPVDGDHVLRGRWADAPIAATVVALAYAQLRHRDISDTELALGLVASVAIVMSAIEYRRANIGVVRPRLNWRDAAARVARNWVEAMLGAIVVVGFWTLVRVEYGRPEFRPLWEALDVSLPVVAPAVLLHAVIAEWRLGRTRDSGTPVLSLLLAGRSGVDVDGLRRTALSLLVRAIFLPLNFCSLVGVLHHFRWYEYDLLTGRYGGAETGVVIYGLLIAAITPGYLFSSRLLATQVKSVDSSPLAWCVTLACYSPFSALIFDRLLDYRARAGGSLTYKSYVDILEYRPGLSALVIFAALMCQLFHYWGEATFGLRSSNLSNRGIIVDGPYRFTKHPVYLSKCVGWFIIYCPVFANDALGVLRSTALLGSVFLIFALRARCEERFLSGDPSYVAYALSMDSKGMFAPLSRRICSLRFSSRLERWRYAQEKHSQR
ncbi:hypothetical protein LQG66_19960 [Bradyrhizobium ontarionense]|uniref:Isoprenylcysteine carboxyl methyltransferase n=1 Tax=Bradyrhizobium ontarionense TaxID=2898149 RepID=A0ABY3R2U2_9BRAD|nr:isoprenylcysteine carboxylmethyltransferase family protein [Bradyrhizobium sp. A19]UFZ01600.1 hypothetical protein LQG66_19960 [Bradyrhizobium sp. A19]